MPADAVLNDLISIMFYETGMTSQNVNKVIRWKQRFSNFEKSFLQLEKAIQIKNPNETERAGLMQFFEITFELSWKTLKDFLEAEGLTTQSPREAIKQAFQSQLIANGGEWIEALEDRNLTVHTYDETTARQIETLIRQKYFAMLQQFYCDFQQKRNA